MYKCKICNYPVTEKDVEFRFKEWYEYCNGCYHTEYNKKYYARCSKCGKMENKGFLEEHEYLCGLCSGVVDEQEYLDRL